MNDLQPIIARIQPWQGAKEIKVEHLAGLTNVNYRVSVDGERFVLRVSGQNTEQLGINRQHEIAGLQAAAAAGIAPELVAFLMPEGHLVTRWVDGCHWDVATFRTPDNVRLLTETVKRIHALAPSAAAFSPFQRCAAFLQTAQRFGVTLPPDFNQLNETMHAIATDQQHDNSDWQRFCHNDLVSVNYLFVERQHSIKILDWEFSGLGDIYYDLATIVYTHDSDGPISPELENVMLECYFGTVTDFQRKRLAGMKFMLMLFTAMWGLAQYGMQRAGLIPAVQGFDYREFADYLFSHDVLELQTQYRQFPKQA